MRQANLQVLGGYDDLVVMFVGTPSEASDESSPRPR
jgi:hypothetical protein